MRYAGLFSALYHRAASLVPAFSLRTGRDGARGLLAVCLLALAWLSVGPAAAAVCTARVTNLTFADVDTLASAPSDGTADIDIDCTDVTTGAAAVTVCASIGAGSGGSYAGERLLSSGASALHYQLYADSAHSLPWGSATEPALGAPQAITLGVSGNTAAETVRLYGMVFGGQSDTVAGTYVSSFAGADISFAYAEGDLSCAALAAAGTAQASLTVQAVVADNCLLSTTPVDFLTHGLLDRTIEATGEVDITCTPGTGYSITMDGGRAAATDPEARLMRSGTNTIVYGLYSDAAYTAPWGATPGTSVTGTAIAAQQSLIPVYGRVLPQKSVPAGTYTDTVTVTITYQ